LRIPVYVYLTQKSSKCIKFTILKAGKIFFLEIIKLSHSQTFTLAFKGVGRYLRGDLKDKNERLPVGDQVD